MFALTRWRAFIALCFLSASAVVMIGAPRAHALTCVSVDSAGACPNDWTWEVLPSTYVGGEHVGGGTVGGEAVGGGTVGGQTFGGSFTVWTPIAVCYLVNCIPAGTEVVTIPIPVVTLPSEPVPVIAVPTESIPMVTVPSTWTPEVDVPYYWTLSGRSCTIGYVNLLAKSVTLTTNWQSCI